MKSKSEAKDAARETEKRCLIETSPEGVLVTPELSARKSTEAVLKESGERLAIATRAGGIGVWDRDVVTDALVWDDRMYELYGVERDRFSGAYEAWKQGLHPDDLERAICEVEQAERGDKPFDTEFRIIRPDGQIRHIRASAHVIRDASGAARRMIGVNYDITVQWQTEQALRNSEARLLAILDTTPFPIALVDARDEKIDYWSRSAVDLFGHTAPTTTEWYQLAYPDPDYRCEVIARWKSALDQARLSGKPVNTGEYHVTCRDGSVRICELYAAFLTDRLVVTFNDITENKKSQAERDKMEAQFIQAQKMESVGRLAGGVAHDFNNLLMGIMNYVELSRDKLPPEHPVRGYLNEIASDAQRSAELTRQLLAFARRQTIAPKVLDLNETVAGTLKMLGRLLGENILLTWGPGTNLWPVKLDPSQVDQVLVNLCVNARDAIAGTGWLTIHTAKVTVDKAFAKEHAGAIPGDYVLLTVSDSGVGMAKDVLARVFEPFFTTKELGKGTGLGLATVHGIVEQNKGFIAVDSEPGKGTTFNIYLPRCLVESVNVPQEAPSQHARGNETVLLVEDEKSVRVTTRMFLEDLGYTVLDAESPEEALRLAAQHNGEMALLITDVIMPGMSGSDMADRLLATRPALKRLFISGFTADIIEQEGMLDSRVPFLSKPFGRIDLARKVREILDGA